MKARFLFIVGFSCLLMAGPGYAKQRRSASKRPVKQEQPADQPATPPLPQTLAEMPPSSPQVSFQGGQLTISAQNSTLGDILKAVRAQTSATIDLPGNAPERVVGHFGPGPARDVLTSLLNGSHFNYLLLGSANDPNALDRVILMAKSAATESNPQPPSEQANAYNQGVSNRPMMPMAAPPGSNTTVVEGQDATDDSADDSGDSTDDTQADDQTDQTDQTDDQQAADDQQQQQPDGQPNIKSPEQLLQELQQRQQQIQQQQGIQPGLPGLPNPGQPGMPPAPPHN